MHFSDKYSDYLYDTTGERWDPIIKEGRDDPVEYRLEVSEDEQDEKIYALCKKIGVGTQQPPFLKRTVEGGKSYICIESPEGSLLRRVKNFWEKAFEKKEEKVPIYQVRRGGAENFLREKARALYTPNTYYKAKIGLLRTSSQKNCFALSTAPISMEGEGDFEHFLIFVEKKGYRLDGIDGHFRSLNALKEYLRENKHIRLL